MIFSDVFEKLKINKLTTVDKQKLDEALSENEIATTLKNMKNHKTPGSDGFPAEFYKVFWNKLKTLITSAFTYYFVEGRLSITLRQSLIICLPKGNKPRQYLKNWRPLSMLSVLYKLLSGTLANRLKTKLDKIISHNQSGFIPNRYIGDTTRLIYDVMHYTEEKKLTGLLMCIDFEKAFDSLSWNFLNKTLDLFNFGNNFKKWVNILNTEIRANVIQCGAFSEPFPILRRCRQGDPIAPYLFILPAEILCRIILQNPHIKGLTIDGFEIKFTQFADDTTIILDDSVDSLQAALNTLEIFGTMSGLKINTEKTKIVWLGRKKHSRDKLNTTQLLQWGITEFCLLGVEFNVDLDKMIELNFSKIILSINEQVNCWNRRNITPLGKIAIIKSLFLAKVNHCMSVLPNPQSEIIDKLNSIFYKFLWSNKPDKIKRTVTMLKYIDGGLKMPNLTNIIFASKAGWLRRLIKYNNDWGLLFKKTFCDPLVITKFGIGIMNEVANKSTNPFWKDVLAAYSTVSKNIKPSSFQDMLDTPLWYNKFLLKESVHFPNWSKANMHFIKDVTDHNGIIKDFFSLKLLANINILEFYQVRYIIKSYIEKFKFVPIKVPMYPTIPQHIQLLFRSRKGNRDFLFELQHQNNVEPTCISSWHKQLNLALNHQTWKTIFHIAHKTINDSYYKWFQLRLIHRILGVNNYLFKTSISKSAICRICNQHPETLLHLFTKCTKVKIFWQQLFEWIKAITKIDLNYDSITLLLGYLLTNNSFIAINTLLILVRKFIFQAARQNSNFLHLDIFKKMLKNLYFEQSNLAEITNTNEKFQKNWITLYPLIENIMDSD